MTECSRISSRPAEAPALNWDTEADWCDPTSFWGNTSWTTEMICRNYLEEIARKFGCPLACVWSLDPVNQVLLLVALHGIEGADLKSFVIRCSDSLCGIAASRKRITRFTNLNEARSDGRSFCHPHLVQAKGLTGMSVDPGAQYGQLEPGSAGGQPLCGRWSAASPGERAKPVHPGVATLRRRRVLSSRAVHPPRRPAPDRAGAGAGAEAKTACAARSARLIQQAVNCEAVAIYLKELDPQRLELAGSADPNRLHQRTNQAHTSAEKCWRRNRESLYVDLDQSVQDNPHPVLRAADEIVSGACVPLQSASGQSRGVIQCLNRCQDVGQSFLPAFTYDDVAVIEAIGRSFHPTLTFSRQSRGESSPSTGWHTSCASPWSHSAPLWSG